VKIIAVLLPWRFKNVNVPKHLRASLSCKHSSNWTLSNLLYYLISRIVRLPDIFIVPLMAENSNEFKKGALHAVYCDSKSTYEELLQNSNPSALHTRQLQDIATIAYKVKNDLVPRYIHFYSHCSLKNSEFVLPRFRTVAYGKHNISYLGRYIWSKLNHIIKSSESVDIFKRCIKSVDFSQLMDRTCKDCFFCSN